MQQAQFQWNAGVEREKGSRTFKTEAELHGTFGVFNPYNLGGLETAIEKSSFVFASLMRLASVTASIEPMVLRRGTKDIEATGRGATMVRELLQSINPESTYYDFVEESMLLLGLQGELLQEKKRNALMGPMGSREVAEIWVKNAKRMRPVPDPTGRRKVLRYDVWVGGDRIAIPWQDAIFTRYPLPRNQYRGLSPVRPMETDVVADINAGLHNLRAIENGVRSGGIFTPQDGYEWTPDMTSQFQEQVRRHNRGPENAGRFLFVPQAGKFFPDGVSHKDMDYQGLRRLAREIIAGVWGVPPILVGNFDASSYANSESQLIGFWHHVGIPLLLKFFGALNEHWVHTEVDPNIAIAPNMAQIEAMIETPTVRSERANKLFMSGVATLNEARRLADLPPERRDFRVIPVNVMPLGLDEAPEDVLRDPPETNGTPSEIAEPTPEEARLFGIQARGLPASVEQRAAAAALHEKQLQAAERVLSKRIRGALMGQAGRLRARLGDLGFRPPVEAAFPTELESLQMYRELQPAVLRVLERAGSEAMRRLGRDNRGAGCFALKDDAPDPFTGGRSEVLVRFDMLNPKIRAFIEEHLARKVRQITSATYRALVREFAVSQQLGEGIGELFARLESMPEFSAMRAERIARTESIGANNMGVLESFRAAGVTRKSWLSARDGDRVRLSHQGVDTASHQHPIRVDERFELVDPVRGRTSAEFPGDPSAAPWAIINCRCALQPEDEEQRDYWTSMARQN